MITGRQHPVEIFYTLKPEQDIIEATFLTCLQVICYSFNDLNSFNYNSI